VSTRIDDPTGALRYVLDGLGVVDLAELHRLVERGRGPCMESWTNDDFVSWITLVSEAENCHWIVTVSEAERRAGRP
jgi:hypothetical protein